MGEIFQYLALRMKRFHIFLVLFCGILFVCLVCGIKITNAKESQKASVKFYKSISIEKGDTLWSIASEYLSPEYDGIEEYIMEICRINHLSDDKIHAGEYLTIPYYDIQETSL